MTVRIPASRNGVVWSRANLSEVKLPPISIATSTTVANTNRELMARVAR